MELEIKHTNVFTKNLKAYEDGYRFQINQGGSRSSKTFSILQLLIFLCLTKPKLKVSIVRKSFPSLRGSVLKDWMEIMDDLGLYDVKKHNKTEHTYTFDNGSMIEFFSIDDAKKVRGRRRHIAYLNEANELNFDDFQQLSLRTESTMIVDFNPSDSQHWIYDLIADPRSILIRSTYRDNNFLHPDIVFEIENLINVDQNYYRIYCLGEQPSKTARIYSHFIQYDVEPECKDWCYGLDIGYVHTSALVKTSFKDNQVYCRELLYESNMIISELVKSVKDIVKDGKNIYVDSARPDVIEELKLSGLNAKSSDKQVKSGIDYIRSKEIFIHNESINLWKEYKSYMYKMVGNVLTEEPIKLLDDGVDALRYSIYTHRNKIELKRVNFY